MRFLGIGDNVVDIYESRHMMYPGGNALNFAVFAKKLGFESAFLGAFGNDEIAAYVKETVTDLGVDISQCRTYSGENGYARVTLSDGDRVFLGSNKGGVLSRYGLKITDKDADYLKNFDLIHFNINGFSDDVLPFVHQCGIPVSYDFSSEFTMEDIERVADFVTVACFSCSHLSEKERTVLAEKVVSLGCKIVLCTMGEEGAILYTEGQAFSQPAHAVEANDTMGAGDAFITCFLVHYLSALQNGDGKDAIVKALSLAASFSAQQCQIEGSFGMGRTVR